MRRYIALTKPRIVAVIVFTAIVGMLLAPNVTQTSLGTWLLVSLGIACAAASGAVLNQYYDVEIDKKMRRTQRRPFAANSLAGRQVVVFAWILACLSALALIPISLPMAMLTMASTIGYGMIYTRYLKYATSQNIVVGGITGAMPPLLGWMALSSDKLSHAMLLTLIVFLWTPPHSWSLALSRKDDYRRAEVPMLPLTHGNRYTLLQIIFYTLLLLAAALLPYAVGMLGWPYLIGSVLLNAANVLYAIWLWRRYSDELAEEFFWWSILYLVLLFTLMLLDRWLRIGGWLELLPASGVVL